MPQTLITERYAADIAGVLNCYDRLVISVQLAPICYAKGMTKYLYIPHPENERGASPSSDWSGVQSLCYPPL